LILKIKRTILKVIKYFLELINSNLLFPIVLNDWRKVDDFEQINQIIGTRYFRDWLHPRQVDLKHIKRIVIIAPHQDDEILGCGGLLLNLRKKNLPVEINVIYLTDGAQVTMPCGQQESVKIRKEEAIQVCKKLKMKPHFLELPNLKFEIDQAAVNRLQELLRNLKPEIILSPWVFDTPIKHRLGNLLLFKCLRSLTFIKGVWGYQVHNMPFPNVYADISDVFQDKLELISMYKSQLKYDAPHDHYSKGMAIWNAKVIKNNSISYAEVFHAVSLDSFLRIFDELITTNLKSYLRGSKRIDLVKIDF